MDIFTRFKTAIKIREVIVDNEIFQLHYRVTALLLLGCAGLVASKQHFGDPIDCITRDDVPNKIMDTYCWIHSTFTLPDACNKTVGSEIAHPCVDKFSQNPREERIYHHYYQWVYFVLFFQACGFYAPHLLWKFWEEKLLRRLTVDLNMRDPLKKGQVGVVAAYFLKIRASHKERHQSYFRCFTLCEALNLLNVIVQIYLVDEFLGGTFTSYGLEVLDYAQMDQEERIDPMVRVFPRMTKCTFHRFGSSGDVQRYDALCILPLNIINEKIYIIMWFWFVFLAIVTGLWLLYRLATHTQPQVRFKVLARNATLVRKQNLTYVLEELGDSGNWFLLSMICKNMESRWFKNLVNNLYQRLKRAEHNKRRPNGSNSNRASKIPSEKELMIDDSASELEDAGEVDGDPESDYDYRPKEDLEVKIDA